MVGTLELVLVKRLLGNGVAARGKVANLNFARTVGLDCFVDAVAGDGKGDSCNLAVLDGFDDLHAAVADLDRVGNGLRVGHKVLQRTVGRLSK